MAIAPIIGVIGSIAGAIVSAAGAKQQADAEANAAAYQAQVARNNATAEAYKGAIKASDTAEKGDYALAKQRAAFAAGGVEVGTGTPVTVFGASSANVAGQVGAAEYEGRIEAQRWQDQAVLNDMRADAARKKGQVAAAGAIIGGVTGAAGALSKGGSGQALQVFS